MTAGRTLESQDEVAALYGALVESLPDALLAVERETRQFVVVNAAAERLLGYSRAELLACGPEDLARAQDLPRLRAVFDELDASGRWTGTWVLRRGDGQVLKTAVIATTATAGGRAFYQACLREADERRRAERAEHLATTLATMGAAPDLESAVEAMLRGAVRLLGGFRAVARLYDPAADGARLVMIVAETATGHLGVEAIDRHTGPARPGSIAAALAAGGPPAIVDDAWALDPAVYPWIDNAKAHGRRASVNVPIAAGQRRLGSLHVDHREPGAFDESDLTIAGALAAKAGALIEQQEAQAALRESEARYRAVVERSADAIGIMVGTRLVYANPARLRLYGLSDPAALADMSPLAYVHPDDQQRLIDYAFARQHGQDVPSLYEFRVVRAGGEVRVVEQSAAAIIYQGQPASLLVARDVTERKQEEAVERERTRFDGAMLVVRTTAHDLNNALAPVVGFSELLTVNPKVQGDPQLSLFAKLVFEASQDMAERVKRLQRVIRLIAVDSPLGAGQPVLDLEQSTACPA